MSDIDSTDPIPDNEAEQAPADDAAEQTGEEHPPGLILATEVLPDEIPLLPLRVRPFFPGFPVPLPIPESYTPLLKHAAEQTSGTIGLVLLRDTKGKEEPDNLHRVGTAAKIVRAVQVPGHEATHTLVNCLERFTIDKVERFEFGMMAHVEYYPEPDLKVNDELKAYAMAIVASLKELTQLSSLQSEAIRMFLERSSLDDPGRLADLAANLTTASGEELQDVLEAFDVRRRIDKVLVLLKKEVELTRLQGEISKQIEEKISGRQREFFLQEQLKAIKQELGLEKEGKTTEIEEFRSRLSTRTPNEEATVVIEEELRKFELLEPASPEYTVTRNYLDWLTVLPWGVFSDESYDVERARKILDRDHYGLDDVKERILEFIAVGRMRGDITGSILCLVGPPGVGKTSIGRSVAEAIGREFYRFSLGGMRDEAEIKGHRRTYIGAMPGKFIQAMKTAGKANPVIMLDEIDKIGASFRGDPASALLEVLDPEQNAGFRDNYLDVPFDLSHVLFIATANQLDTIPGPLLDRMELIRLSGYVLEEKVEIATRYLVPKALEQHGIAKNQVRIRKPALRRIIEGYAREAGVRSVEKQIRKIMRKSALEFSKNPDRTIVVDSDDVEKYLGKPAFTEDELIERRPGVVTGLAWTSFGGATLPVEATAVRSQTRGFKQTGQLGNVMQESSEIAYTYAMGNLERFGGKDGFFDRHFVHLHVPAGATPKDGPSAGVTMTTALLSMALGQTPQSKLAMTGELTLTGQVLPIGGVKEKVIAARRAGYKSLVFPEANRKDVEELPDYLRKGIEFHFAGRYDDVFAVAFGE